MSAEIECIAKKWGGSIGIVIPQNVVEEQHIQPNEAVRVVIKKIPLGKDIWALGGQLPAKKRTISSQDAKDELRRAWQS